MTRSLHTFCEILEIALQLKHCNQLDSLVISCGPPSPSPLYRLPSFRADFILGGLMIIPPASEKHVRRCQVAWSDGFRAFLGICCVPILGCFNLFDRNQDCRTSVSAYSVPIRIWSDFG